MIAERRLLSADVHITPAAVCSRAHGPPRGTVEQYTRSRMLHRAGWLLSPAASWFVGNGQRRVYRVRGATLTSTRPDPYIVYDIFVNVGTGFMSYSIVVRDARLAHGHHAGHPSDNHIPVSLRTHVRHVRASTDSCVQPTLESPSSSRPRRFV